LQAEYHNPDFGFSDGESGVVVVFDTRIPGIAERLHRERAAWRENADIKALSPDHLALIVKPGGARGLAA